MDLSIQDVESGKGLPVCDKINYIFGPMFNSLGASRTNRNFLHRTPWAKYNVIMNVLYTKKHHNLCHWRKTVQNFKLKVVKIKSLTSVATSFS